MTREWSPDEVETYHQRMQALRAERDDYYRRPALGDIDEELLFPEAVAMRGEDDATPVDP